MKKVALLSLIAVLIGVVAGCAKSEVTESDVKEYQKGSVDAKEGNTAVQQER